MCMLNLFKNLLYLWIRYRATQYRSCNALDNIRITKRINKSMNEFYRSSCALSGYNTLFYKNVLLF